jgi:serine/threonine protein kinase
METGPGTQELEVGQTFGHYRLESLLGEGAMGLVFRATREDGQEPVALKVMRAQLNDDDVFSRRFRHEARAMGEIEHESLVPIVEAGEIDGRNFLAVAYVEGGSLADRLREGPLPVADALRLAGELAGGLDALHARGVLHRDIKAANVLFGADGRAMLTDFGLARGRAYTVLTKPGQVVGTLDYLAPELIRGRPATPASDIYAFGCTIFECLTGRTPFADKTLLQIGLAHLDEPPPDPATLRLEVSPDLGRAALAALEKEPERRPESAGAYASLLLRAS